jgi:hypothetical protein
MARELKYDAIESSPERNRNRKGKKGRRGRGMDKVPGRESCSVTGKRKGREERRTKSWRWKRDLNRSLLPRVRSTTLKHVQVATESGKDLNTCDQFIMTFNSSK